MTCSNFILVAQETWVQCFFPSQGGENAASASDMKHSPSCSRTLQQDSHFLLLLHAASDQKEKACCAFSPPVSVPVPVSGARTAPAAGPPTPAAVHPAPGGWRRGRGRGRWPTTLFLLPPAPAVILAVRRAPTHAGWQSAGITHTRAGLLTS